MRVASNVLLKLGRIFSIICAVMFLVCVPIFLTVFLLPDFHDQFIAYLQSIGIDGDGSAEALSIILMVYVVAIVVILVIAAVLMFIAASFCSKALHTPSKGRYIACIIIGAMSMNLVLIGGIFGLIAQSREDRQNANQNY